VVILVAILEEGCVTPNSFLSSGEDIPTNQVCQAVVAWYPEVIFTPDPTHRGQPTPGIAGRVYLFGPEIDSPLTGDGAVIVDLYDDTVAGSAMNPNAVPLEEWQIDKATLKRLKKKDAVGMGYTLFLPWSTYRPEAAHVHLRLRYEPAKGTPIYAESSPMVLNRDIAITSQHGTVASLPPTGSIRQAGLQTNGQPAMQTAVQTGLR
jgi:hypothetical protein